MKLENYERVEHYDTDFGFILVYPDGHVDLFGMVGVGRYELFGTAQVEDSLEEALEEALEEHDISVYVKTKSLLSTKEET
jgi:hypothetical protein